MDKAVILPCRRSAPAALAAGRFKRCAVAAARTQPIFIRDNATTPAEQATDGLLTATLGKPVTAFYALSIINEYRLRRIRLVNRDVLHGVFLSLFYNALRHY